MNYFREISSSETAGAGYVARGGELRLSNLGQKELLLALAEKGAALRTEARGFSMWPFIRDKDILTIAPLQDKKPSVGDVVAFTLPFTEQLAIHRIIGKTESGWLIKGDNCLEPDGEVPNKNIIGYVCRIEHNENDANFGLGRCSALIAYLSRFNILTACKKFLFFLRQIAEFVLPKIQSLGIYRLVARNIARHVDISEASRDDMEKVHEIFNPGAPYIKQEANSNVTNWVAKKNGGIIAFTQNVYQPEENNPWTGEWLFSLYVRARYRGAGIGKMLTEKVIAKAKEQNATDIKLVVFEDNKAATCLYQKLGFERIMHPGLEPLLADEKIKTGRRRIVMKKKLV